MSMGLGRNVIAWLKIWAKTIKRDVIALWLAARDPRTPWYVKLLAGATAAYALSPIDLIPDFIPVIGYLDDLVIVPLGIAFTVALMPKGLMAEMRSQADSITEKPVSRGAAMAVVVIWIAAAAALVWLGWVYFVGEKPL